MIEFNARFVPFTNGSYVMVMNRGGIDLKFTMKRVAGIPDGGDGMQPTTPSTQTPTIPTTPIPPSPTPPPSVTP